MVYEGRACVVVVVFAVSSKTTSDQEWAERANDATARVCACVSVSVATGQRLCASVSLVYSERYQTKANLHNHHCNHATTQD